MNSVITNNILDPAYNEFDYYEQYTGSYSQRVRLFQTIYWVLLTTSLIITNNALGPA